MLHTSFWLSVFIVLSLSAAHPATCWKPSVPQPDILHLGEVQFQPLYPFFINHPSPQSWKLHFLFLQGGKSAITAHGIKSYIVRYMPALLCRRDPYMSWPSLWDIFPQQKDDVTWISLVLALRWMEAHYQITFFSFIIMKMY